MNRGRVNLQEFQQTAGEVVKGFNQPLQSLMIIAEIIGSTDDILNVDISEKISQQVARMSELVNKLENMESELKMPDIAQQKMMNVIERSEPGTVRSKKILLIDDDEQILKVLIKIINKEGFEVETAKSGKLGISRLKSNDYGLVICDLQLPDITGIEIFNCRDHRNKETPIIFISGYVLEDLNELVRGQSIGFLNKPFSTKEVSKVLKKVFNY